MNAVLLLTANRLAWELNPTMAIYGSRHGLKDHHDFLNSNMLINPAAW